MLFLPIPGIDTLSSFKRIQIPLYILSYQDRQQVLPTLQPWGKFPPVKWNQDYVPEVCCWKANRASEPGGWGAVLGGPGAAVTHQCNDGGTSSNAGHDEQVIGHIELGKNRAPGEQWMGKDRASTCSFSSRAAFHQAVCQSALLSSLCLNPGSLQKSIT